MSPNKSLEGRRARWRRRAGSRLGATPLRSTIVLYAALVVGASALAPPILAAGGPAVLDLPGPPAKILPCDLDRDGHPDLLVLAAFTEWDRVTFDRIEDAVQVTDVVPALFDRRVLVAFLGDGRGGYDRRLGPLNVSESLIALDDGPPADGPLALTHDGASAVGVGPQGEGLALELLVPTPPVLSGVDAFLPRLDFTADLDGDGDPDLLLPTNSGLAIHIAREGSIPSEPDTTLAVPGRGFAAAGVLVEHYPLPQVEDFDGDGRADLLFSSTRPNEERHWLLAGRGAGRFGEPRELSLDPALELPAELAERWEAPRLVFLGDLDGEPGIEAVTASAGKIGKVGLIGGMRAAKRPRMLFRVFPLDGELQAAAGPATEIEATGYGFGGSFPDVEAGAFTDLDGDGRRDLVTITLDFSLMQAVRVMVARSLNIGVDFHVWRQRKDGAFEEVKALDLSERLRFNLKRLRLGSMAHFAGDFDGDGRKDFIHLGRGRDVTVHRGQPGCRYPVEPDMRMRLDRKVQALELVRVDDFDLDGKDDLLLIVPGEADDREETAPVRLRLYRGGGTGR